jgi:hypothetical protein
MGGLFLFALRFGWGSFDFGFRFRLAGFDHHGAEQEARHVIAKTNHRRTIIVITVAAAFAIAIVVGVTIEAFAARLIEARLSAFRTLRALTTRLAHFAWLFVSSFLALLSARLFSGLLAGL